MHESLQKCKNGSMENALDGSRGTLISKVDFILGVRQEYGVEDPYIEMCLERFFDAFNCERPRSLELLCVYMTIVFSKLVEENPRKLIVKLCEMCSSKDVIRIDIVQMIVDLGRHCTSDCDDDNFSTPINDIAQLCMGGKERDTIKTAVVSEILDLRPQLIIQFGENVRESLPSSVRMEILSNIQVRKVNLRYQLF